MKEKTRKNKTGKNRGKEDILLEAMRYIGKWEMEFTDGKKKPNGKDYEYMIKLTNRLLTINFGHPVRRMEREVIVGRFIDLVVDGLKKGLIEVNDIKEHLVDFFYYFVGGKDFWENEERIRCTLNTLTEEIIKRSCYWEARRELKSKFLERFGEEGLWDYLKMKKVGEEHFKDEWFFGEFLLGLRDRAVNIWVENPFGSFLKEFDKKPVEYLETAKSSLLFNREMNEVFYSAFSEYLMSYLDKNFNKILEVEVKYKLDDIDRELRELKKVKKGKVLKKKV